MDKTKSPGISIESVHLLDCVVGDVRPEVEQKFSIGISHLKRTIVSDGKILLVTVSFDLMKGVENPPCKFQCAFLATYTRSPESNMTWDEFHDHIAVAHLIPFVREFVSNITNRLPLPVLMIPPLNTNQMVKEYQQLTIQQAAAK